MGPVCSVQSSRKEKGNFIVNVPDFKKSENRPMSPPLKVQQENGNALQPQRPLSTGFDLTSEQRQLIHETWDNVADKHLFTQSVFVRIFAAKPTLKRLFNLETVAADQLMNFEVFVGHSRRFAGFLTFMVASLDHDESGAVIYSKTLGRDHVKFCQNTKFDIKYWHLFVHAVVDEFENELLKVDINLHNSERMQNLKQTWALFLNQVVELMRNGYTNAQTAVDSLSIE